MEKDNRILKVYCLGGPWLSTEWSTLMGSKYRDHMNFEPVLVSDPEEAQVIVWDGVLTPKSSEQVSNFVGNALGKKVFLMTGEAATSLENHPFVKLDQFSSAVFLPPSKVLPEEILEALELCRKRLTDV